MKIIELVWSYTLNFIYKLTAIAMFLLINNLALAANIDFKTINNNQSKTCIDNQAKEGCENTIELPPCQPVGSKDEPCNNVETKENTVEPKFSTKRPRGQ